MLAAGNADECPIQAYFPFACIFFCSLPYTYFLIPETKGLPLEYMDRLFGGERSDVEKALEEGAVKQENHFIEDTEAKIAGVPTLPTVRE